MKSVNVFLGVMAGVAIGAALGILFAPNKGSVTRDQLVMKGDEVAEDVKERFSGIIENFLKKIESSLQSMKRETESAHTDIKVEGL